MVFDPDLEKPHVFNLLILLGFIRSVAYAADQQYLKVSIAISERFLLSSYCAHLVLVAPPKLLYN